MSKRRLTDKEREVIVKDYIRKELFGPEWAALMEMPAEERRKWLKRELALQRMRDDMNVDRH